MGTKRARSIGAAAAALLLAVWAAPAAAQSSLVFTVAAYPVEATAGDAVSAKNRAIAEGKQGAFRYLLKRVVDVRAYKRLPHVAAAAIDDLIEGVEVKGEQNSSTEYIATLSFSFRADAIRELLRQYDLPYSDRQAEPIAVMPVFLEPAAGQGKAGSRQLAWRRAWEGLDLTHALTPLSVVAPGPSASDDVFARLVEGDGTALGVLSAEVDAGRLVVALASLEASGKLAVTLLGADWVGTIGLRRTYAVPDGDLSYAQESAAIISLAVLEGRHKARAASNGTAETFGAATPGLDDGRIHLQVEFASLAEWQSIRARIGDLPGLKALSTGSLSPRGAEVAISYASGVAGLRSDLARQGLALLDLDGKLLLRAN